MEIKSAVNGVPRNFLDYVSKTTVEALIRANWDLESAKYRSGYNDTRVAEDASGKLERVVMASNVATIRKQIGFVLKVVPKRMVPVEGVAPDDGMIVNIDGTDVPFGAALGEVVKRTRRIEGKIHQLAEELGVVFETRLPPGVS